MIEPFKSGQELIDEIDATAPKWGTVALWWLGQSGFLLKSETFTILIDPYLSEHLTTKYAATNRPHVRMTRAPLRGGDLKNVDVVLCSHKHSDHLDPGTLPDLLEASPNAVVVLPRAIVSHALGLGIPADRIVGLNANEVWIRSRIRPYVQIRAVASAHESLDTDVQGRSPYLGFDVYFNGVRLYHTGDCVPYAGLARNVGLGVDVAFLPINGRDPARGVPGNMTAAEAVDLANALKFKYVVPHHYEMFEFNTVDVREFEHEAKRLAPGVEAKVLRCGERWEVRQ